MILDKIKARGDELAMLQGHDRLQYLVDLAREVEPLDDKDKTEENKIRGCASNLWVTGKQNKDGTVVYHETTDEKYFNKAVVLPKTTALLGSFEINHHIGQ